MQGAAWGGWAWSIPSRAAQGAAQLAYCLLCPLAALIRPPGACSLQVEAIMLQGSFLRARSGLPAIGAPIRS